MGAMVSVEVICSIMSDDRMHWLVKTVIVLAMVWIFLCFFVLMLGSGMPTGIYNTIDLKDCPWFNYVLDLVIPARVYPPGCASAGFRTTRN